MRSAMLLLAEGFEEMEAVILADVLRRAKWHIILAGVTGNVIVGSRHIKMVADAAWNSLSHEEFDVLILPGGREGTRRLCDESSVRAAVAERARSDRWIAAVCAAPLVLKTAGILEGRKFTSHPSVRDEIGLPGWEDKTVVTDGKIVTSQGPGTCFSLALTLIGLLDGPSMARDVATGLVLPSVLAGG